MELVGRYRADREAWRESVVPRTPISHRGTTYWPDLVCDDLGVEPLARTFGETAEAVAVLIDIREDHFQRTGARLHLATNLSSEELRARYGVRIESRLAAMCLWREFTGEDWRKTTYAPVVA